MDASPSQRVKRTIIDSAKISNQKHNSNVVLLGWSTANNDGTFTGNFTSTDDGQKSANTLVAQGADIIFPVDGAAGLGSAAYCQQTGACLIIGADNDWFDSAPEYQSVELTSVEKKVDVMVYDVIQTVQSDTFKGGTYIGTLANSGVGIAPFHDFENKIPSDLKAELGAINNSLQMGSISVDYVLNH